MMYFFQSAFLLILFSAIQNSKEEESEVATGTADLSSKLINMYKEYTQYQTLIEMYEKYFDEDVVKLSKVDPQSVLKELSSNLGEALEAKIKALKKAVEFAENETRTYRWNGTDRKEEEKEEDVKDRAKFLDKCEACNYTWENSSVFDQEVIFGQSVIHIPTEIYAFEDFIQKGINFSAALDGVFIENEKKLRYQFYASGDGFMRLYPGIKWRRDETEENLDLYDVRQRPWYIQGSSSPKDVLFIIDTSGSMHGHSLQLTQRAVKRLIETLGENDYVGVAQFPGLEKESFNPVKNRSTEHFPHLLSDDKTNVSKSCFKQFVQATRRNKKHIDKLIDNLEARGIAEFDDALDFAFYTFNQFPEDPENNQGADCNKIIIIVTDGGGYYPEDRIGQLQAQFPLIKDVRIFTYAVGEAVTKSSALEDIACKNKGHFSAINAIGAVSNIIQSYLREVHHHSSSESFEEVGTRVAELTVHSSDEEEYLSDFHRGTGLMASLTLPIYNRTGNLTLLGLMGTDVTVRDMQDYVPYDKIGPNGYGFVLNMNGYLFFHPGLKRQQDMVRDTPNVDFMEVEYISAEKEKIRREMIDFGAADNKSPLKSEIKEKEVDDFVKIFDNIHVYKKNRIYIYKSLPNSSFGLALVIPKENTHFLQYNSDKVFSLSKKDDNETATYEIKNEKTGDVICTTDFTKFGFSISRIFPYCVFNVLSEEDIKKETDDTVSENLDFSLNILDKIVEDLDYCITPMRCGEVKCKPIASFKHRITSMLMDIASTQAYMEKHTDLWDKRNDSIEFVFVITNTGVAYSYPVSPEQLLSKLGSVPKSAAFERAYDNSDLLIFDTDMKTGVPRSPASSPPPPVRIFQSVSVKRGGNYVFGVVGLQVTQESIEDLVKSTPACNSEDFTSCYLLDDGGYVISTSSKFNNNSHVIGYFFGYVERAAMTLLVNNSVFETKDDFDYQAICDTDPEHEPSSAWDWRVPLFSTIWNLIVGAFNIASLWTDFLFHLVFMNPIQELKAEDSGSKQFSCIMRMVRYYSTGTALPQDEIMVDCGPCNITVSAAPVKGTNLVLVAVNKPPACKCPVDVGGLMDRDPKNAPMENFCERAEKPRYRRRPPQCFAYNPEEGTNPCFAIAPTPSSLAILSLSLVALLSCT